MKKNSHLVAEALAASPKIGTICLGVSCVKRVASFKENGSAYIECVAEREREMTAGLRADGCRRLRQFSCEVVEH